LCCIFFKIFENELANDALLLESQKMNQKKKTCIHQPRAFPLGHSSTVSTVKNAHWILTLIVFLHILALTIFNFFLIPNSNPPVQQNAKNSMRRNHTARLMTQRFKNLSQLGYEQLFQIRK